MYDLDFDEPFEVRIEEDNDPNRPHFYLYNGLLTSPLFNAHETILLIYLIASSDNNEPDQINIATISVNELSKKTGMNKAMVSKYIKSLEKKGVVIRKNSISGEDGCVANTYEILNFISVWDCKTLDKLKKETNKIKKKRNQEI